MSSSESILSIDYANDVIVTTGTEDIDETTELQFCLKKSK